jgi:hypothetical protein
VTREAEAGENERLRRLVATLESDRVRLAERVGSVEALLQELDLLRGAVSALEREKLNAQIEQFAAREERDTHRRERERLERRMSFYAASERLYGTRDRPQVLGAIEKIVVNLIGSEELGVYELESAEWLRLVASLGIDPTAHDRVRVGSGRIGRVAATGELDIGAARGAAGRPQESSLTACVPLKIDGRVIGAIAVFRLRPPKVGLECVDRERLELLGPHAATALYCTRLPERLEAQASS